MDVIVQARQTSTRLPNKVMLEICGDPIYKIVYDRLTRCRANYSLVFAVPDNKANKDLRDGLQHHDIPFFAGDEDNVASRYLKTCEQFDYEDAIVRVTCDCPLIDPFVVDMAMSAYRLSPKHHIVRHLNPKGFDCEVFDSSLLKKVLIHGDAYDKEHVTPYIWKNFPTMNLQLGDGHPDNFSVDTQEDYDMVRLIIQKLGKYCTMEEVKQFIRENPSVIEYQRYQRYVGPGFTGNLVG